MAGALRSAFIAAGALIVEEVLVTSRGGPALLTGVAGSIATIIDHFADPSLPAIPNPAGYGGTTGGTVPPTTTLPPATSQPSQPPPGTPVVRPAAPGTVAP